jgi:hypothetical protein
MIDVVATQHRAGWTPAGRHRSIALVVFAGALFVRNLLLAARGGGSTPRLLLGLETTLWGVTAAGGIAARRGSGVTGESSDRLERAVATAAWCGVATHGVRLAIYLRKRRWTPCLDAVKG